MIKNYHSITLIKNTLDLFESQFILYLKFYKDDYYAILETGQKYSENVFNMMLAFSVVCAFGNTFHQIN